MALNSMGTQSTERVSWTPHLRGLHSRLTRIDPSLWANQSSPATHHSYRRLFQRRFLVLCNGLRISYQLLGLRSAGLQLQAKEARRKRQLKRYRWQLKLKAYLWSLPNTAQRMYWRITLPLAHRSEQIRMWTGYRRVLIQMKTRFPSSRLKTARQRFGGSDDIT